MTTNQARAAQIINAAHIESARDFKFPNPSALAQALADAGLLAPDPIAATTVPLEPGDRSFVIDRLMGNLQRANVLGSPGMAEAWGVAANAFVAATREKE